MSAEDNADNRQYKVILLDRTTSARVNSLIRELTGLSNKAVSELMNKPPADIVDGLTLNQAIDVKSQLARLGVRAKVESYNAAVKDEADIIQDKHPTADPESKAETERPSEQPPASEAIEPAVIPSEQQKESEEKKKKRIWIPIFWIFGWLLIIVIIILLMIYFEPANNYIKRLASGKITSHETDDEDYNKSIRYKKSADDFLTDLKKPDDKKPGIIALQPDQKPESEPDSTQEAAGDSRDEAKDQKSASTVGKPGYGGPAKNRSGDRGENKQSGLFSPKPSAAGAGRPDAGGSGDSGLGESGGSPAGADGGGSHGGAPGGGESGSTGSPDADGSPGKTGGSGSPGSGDGSGSGQPALIPSGNPMAEDGLLPDNQLRDLLAGAKTALAIDDLSMAAAGHEKLKLANMMNARAGMPNRIEFIDPLAQELVNDLKKASDKYKLSRGLDFYPEMTGIKIRVHTNLPDGAMVKAVVDVPGGEKSLEFTLPVQANIIEIPVERGFPSGEIKVKVVLLPLKKQIPYFKEIAGDDGEYLSGPYIKGKGKAQFNSSVINPRARTKADVNPENAKNELELIAKSEGMENFQAEDIREFDAQNASFFTLSADNIEESDFIIKACRSAGLLTTEMDDPPEYLRLVINGYQYFVPTLMCRKLLRDFNKDDPEGFEFLLNQVVSL